MDEQSCLLPQLGSGPTTDNFGSGFFSEADYVEIFKPAKAAQHRNITKLICQHTLVPADGTSMEARYTPSPRWRKAKQKRTNTA
ncbi:hypothetical protein OK016_13835 [Vibrio chagasii]|nr:hypothetical protein [Vibrio chagasii]